MKAKDNIIEKLKGFIENEMKNNNRGNGEGDEQAREI